MAHQNTIEEAQVLACLDNAGLRYQVRGRYLVTQCPKHQERNPSCQIFKDDWFCSCLAGCGRFHITQAFPELKGDSPIERTSTPAIERTYETFDLTQTHARLPLIPRTHTFKGLPLEVLDGLGWRWDEPKSSYFIPYYNHTRTKIPFAQWRHLSGPRRFTFLAGARPTLYGKWNIHPGERLFIVEGTSDCAILQQCRVPWIGIPSASSGALLQKFAAHALTLGCSLVYAGDNDTAGDALRACLDGAGLAYRVCQPPTAYKDWGDFYEAEGELAVFDWCKDKLFEGGYEVWHLKI